MIIHVIIAVNLWLKKGALLQINFYVTTAILKKSPLAKCTRHIIRMTIRILTQIKGK